MPIIVIDIWMLVKIGENLAPAGAQSSRPTIFISLEYMAIGSSQYPDRVFEFLLFHNYVRLRLDVVSLSAWSFHSVWN